MPFEKLLIFIPKWIFTFIAIIVPSIIIYLLIYTKDLQCRHILFGLPFGPDNSCTSSQSISGIEILEKGSNKNNSETYQDTINIKYPALLFMQAYGNATRVGDTKNAGLIIQIKVNNKSCGNDRSFEAQTSSITFYSNVTCTRLLEPGEHTLEAKIIPHKGINKNKYFKVEYYLVKAGKIPRK